jgi:hypothetical protein
MFVKILEQKNFSSPNQVFIERFFAPEKGFDMLEVDFDNEN